MKLSDLREKAVSKAQQKFMGMVRAKQKGEMDDASPEVAKAAKSMSKKDVKDFASTKHKGLPDKKEGVEENRYSPLQMAKAKKEREDRKKKDGESDSRYQRIMKKQYGSLKKEEVEQIDEISAKLARKAAAASDARAFDYGSSVYDDESQKNADRLSKKADKALAHVRKRQGEKGIRKTNRLSNKLIYGKSRYSEEVEVDEAKGTGVKKFVKGMRVAKTSNPDMKGTVIKGGDNLKKAVEVEWDSGTTTMASGKYLMSIKKESVELDKQMLDEGVVEVITAALGITAMGLPIAFNIALFLGMIADTLEKDKQQKFKNMESKLRRGQKLTREEIGMIKDAISQNKSWAKELWDKHIKNVRMMKESVDLGEAKISVGDRVTLQPNKNTLDRSLIGKAGVVTGMVGSKPTVKFANGKTIAVSTKDLKVNESVELDEASYPLAKKWQSGAKVVKKGKVELTRGSGGVHSIKVNGKSVGDFSLDDDAGMWVTNINGKKGQGVYDEIDDIVNAMMKESVQHTLFSLREARRDAAKDLYFDTYSAAVQTALADVKKKGFEVDEDDWHDSITTGPGKPGRGKTVRHTVGLTKGGKPQRKALHIQVYNRDTDKKTYELNYYVS